MTISACFLRGSIYIKNDTSLNSFSSYRQISYPNSQPRIYYPGTTTAYKYWVTPKNQNVNWIF